MALTLVTSDLIHGLDYSKLTGTIPTWNQDTTGSAATLTTARNIGGVSFNGSAAINLPGVNTAGNQNTSGVAATATLLATARTIGGVSFNGSTSINLPGVNIAGNQDTSGNAGTVTNGVYTVGNQTIGGTKTFSSAATFQLSALTNPSGVDANTVLTIKNNGWSGITMLSSAAAGSFLTFGDADAGFRGRIQYLQGSTDAMVFETAASEKIRITSGGNVGIGTAAPNDGKLQVSANSSSDWAGYFFNQSTSGIGVHVEANSGGTQQVFRTSSRPNGGSNAVTMAVLANGNVGIGTSSPTTALTIRKEIASAAYGQQASMIEFKSYFPAYDTETVKSAIYSGVSSTGSLNTEGGFLAFHVNNNGTMGEKLRIDKSGNVGIGTTSPGHPLDVNGTIRGNRLRILPNGVNNSYIFVDSNATFAGALSIQAGEGSSGYGGTFIAYGHSHASRAGFVSAGISNGSNGKFTVMNHGNGSGSDVFSVNTNGSVSLYNSNTAVIGRPYMTGTLANGASITINANGAGGDQSVGFIAVSCVPNISAEGGAVALFSHIHTQGANGYTQMQLRNENNITISESSGQFTISNSSGHTAHYNFKVLNIIDKSTTILGI